MKKKQSCILLMASVLKVLKSKNNDRMHDLRAMYEKTLEIASEMFEDDTNEFGNFSFKPVTPKMSDLQVIALAVSSESACINSENLLFSKLKTDFKSRFPELIDRTRFNRRRRALMDPVLELTKRISMTMGVDSQIDIVDSMPCPIVKNSRERNFKICKEDESTAPRKGYSAVDRRYYIGYKLHLLTNEHGVFQDLQVTPANVHDINFLKELQPETYSMGISPQELNKTRVIDMNGDGVNELLVVENGSGSQAKTFELDTWTTPGTVTATKVLETGFPTQWHSNVIPADFNGDRNTDLYSVSGGIHRISLSKGLYSAGYETITLNGLVPTNSTLQNTSISDFNGDGRSDILIKYRQPNSQQFFKVLFFNSDQTYSIFEDEVTDAPVNSYSDLLPSNGDFNGDGRTDLFLINSNSTNPRYFSFTSSGDRQHLSAVKDSYGNISNIRYECLTHQEDSYVFHSTQVGGSYPIYQVTMPLQVVHSTIGQNVFGNDITSLYSYAGVTIHGQGKGFLGFGQIQTSTNSEGVDDYSTINTKQFDLDQEFYFRSPRQLFEHLVDDWDSAPFIQGAELSSSFYDNNVQDLGNNRYFPFVEVMWEWNKHLNKYRVRYSDYDDYGNLLTDSVFIQGWSFALPEKLEVQVTKNYYSEFGTWWIPNRLDSSVVRNERRGQTVPYVRRSTFDYYPNGEVQSSTADFGLTESFTYDGFGNKTTVVANGSGAESQRTTTYTYDDIGRNILTQCNSLGNCQTFTYHPTWSSLHSSTDISGHSTSFDYDSFGRLTYETNPLGNSTQYQLEWIQADPPSQNSDVSQVLDGLYKKIVTIDGGGETEEWYNSQAYRIAHHSA